MNLFIIHLTFNVSVSKCGGSSNTYAQTCVSSKVRNMNAIVFDLMSEASDTRILIQHDSCECKCRLNENICYTKQKWNRDKYWWEFKELDDRISCHVKYF